MRDNIEGDHLMLSYRHLSIIMLYLAFITGCSDSSNNEPVQNPQVKPVSTPLTIEATSESEVCALKMGWEPWEPYHYQENGLPVKGLDIEMMEMISSETNCHITYVKGDWKELLASLKKGDVDFLTGASINERRKQYAKFSDGYRTESFRLFVRTGELQRFSGHNLKALVDAGFRLGITMDYIYNNEVETLLDDPTNAKNIFAVSTGLINFSKLLENDIDGFLEDPVVGRSSIRRQALENQIELHPYVINTGDVHIMFSQVSVSEDVIDKFNHALAKIRHDGRHQRLIDKYTN